MVEGGDGICVIVWGVKFFFVKIYMVHNKMNFSVLFLVVKHYYIIIDELCNEIDHIDNHVVGAVRGWDEGSGCWWCQ